jgi:hypothetical protein
MAPWGGLLELGGESEQGGFVAEAAGELHADGQAVGCPSSGTDMAGCPVALNTGVMLAKRPTSSRYRDRSPRGSTLSSKSSKGASPTENAARCRNLIPSKVQRL